MPYIIDGHNLIGKMHGLSLDQLDDEEKLIQRVQQYCGSTQKRAEIYFDRASPGNAGRRKHGRVTAIFVREGTTADDAIHRKLRELKKAARNWTVVSSDRRVQVEAKAVGAAVISAENFAKIMDDQRVNQTRSGDAPLADDEIQEWLKAFGAEDED